MRTFLRAASAMGMGLGTILFVIGLASLIGKGEGALFGSRFWSYDFLRPDLASS